jgi:hypothetical protein
VKRGRGSVAWGVGSMRPHSSVSPTSIAGSMAVSSAGSFPSSAASLASAFVKPANSTVVPLTRNSTPWPVREVLAIVTVERLPNWSVIWEATVRRQIRS